MGSRVDIDEDGENAYQRRSVLPTMLGAKAFPTWSMRCWRSATRQVARISGLIVNLDMRTMYLRDLTLIGCTAWDEPVFPNLVGYIERGEIKPLIAQTFKLQDIVDAQKAFLEKTHVGKFYRCQTHPNI